MSQAATAWLPTDWECWELPRSGLQVSYLFGMAWSCTTLRPVGQITFFTLDALGPEGRLTAKPNPGDTRAGESQGVFMVEIASPGSVIRPPSHSHSGSDGTAARPQEGRPGSDVCLHPQHELWPEVSPKMPSLRVCNTNSLTLSTTWPPAPDGSHPGCDARRFRFLLELGQQGSKARAA